MLKRKITISALALAAGVGGAAVSWISVTIPQDTQNKSLQYAADINKQCDPANQADSEILAQAPSNNDCYFSGCSGFF